LTIKFSNASLNFVQIPWQLVPEQLYHLGPKQNPGTVARNDRELGKLSNFSNMAKISVATVNELANKRIPCLEDNKNYDSSDMRILIELTDVESMTGKTIKTET